jgi:polyhydroxyalkanoate synthesis regulator phasin
MGMAERGRPEAVSADAHFPEKICGPARRTDMETEDFWRKAWFFGLGLANFTRAKVEALVEDMIKRGEISQQERSQTVEELWARWKAAQEAFWEKVKEVVAKAVHDLKPARAEDLEALAKRVDALERELVEREIEGRQGAIID